MRTDESSLRHDPVSMSQARRAFAAQPVAALLATGFGSGLSPIAPGTAGSLVGLAVGVAPRVPWRDSRLAGRTVDVRARRRTASASPSRAPCAGRSASKDPGCIVIDEVAGQLVACAGAGPRSRSAALGLGRRVSCSFALFDIVKPLGIARLQGLPGGWGDRRRRPPGRALRGAASWRSPPDGRERLTLSPEEGSIAPEEPLSRHTTWRIGGPARFFCRVKTEAALARILSVASREAAPLALLGMGSNILVADEGFPGYVLRLEGDFLKVDIDGERVYAGGGAALGGVCAAAARAGLSGIEAISGIPSSIGGAVRINAGAYGGEIFDVLETVRLVARSGERRAASAEEIPHGYRWSKLIETREIVSQAVLKLARAPREEIQAKTRTVADKRRGALPSGAQRGKRLQESGGGLRRAPHRGLRLEGRAGRRRR